MTVQFGAFTFDSRSGQLRRNDQAIPLPGAASEVLVALLENRPDMVRKETLLERVWRGTAVSEASLSVAIAKLREALSDDPQQPRFIRTFHRKGYAFIAEATELTEHGGHAAGVSVFVLEWNGQRLVLNEGENVVGRNPLRSSVCIDEPRVSGRHARILVAGGSAVIEDLHSTNHTFVGRLRVTAPHTLADGDVIRFGGPTAVFRRADTATVHVKPRGRSSA